MTDERQVFNSQIKQQFRKTHTPQCAKCNEFRPWGDDYMVVHHKKMLCEGGTNDVDNLVCLCRRCHDEWHKYFDVGEKKDFGKWIQEPPAWIYGAMVEVNMDDKEKRDSLIHYIDTDWWRIKDYRLTEWSIKTPKNKRIQDYVRKNSDNWVDW